MKTLPIELSEAQLEIIGTALSNLPYRIAKPVIDHINEQIALVLASNAAPNEEGQMKRGAEQSA